MVQREGKSIMQDVLMLAVTVMLPYIAPAIFIILVAIVAMEFSDLIRFAAFGSMKKRRSY